MIWKPNATVAAIIERDQRFLLVEEIIQGEAVFNQPAGHLEDNESYLEAVVRETREETAWRFHPEHLVGTYKWKHPSSGTTYIRMAYCGHVDDFDDSYEIDSDIEATHWLSREELLAHPNAIRSPLVLRCIDDYLAGIRYPLESIIEVD